MKVLHVVKRMDLAGGAERMISEIVKSEESHFILYFAGKGSFYTVPPKKLIRARNLLHALLKCHLSRGEFDVIHLHLFPAIYFSMLLGAKSIIHEHSTHNKRRDILLARPMEFIIYRRAACVIAISDAAKHSLSKWTNYESGIVALNNFVSPLPQKYANGNFSKLALPRRVLMVASFTPAKRQDLLISAIPYLPKDIEIYFAGDGPNLAQMRQLVDDMGLQERVTFLGNVENIREEYEKADLCALLSDWEGFGLTIVEAAQHGVVTLVRNVPGARDIVPDKTWIIEDDAPQAVAQKITSFLEHHTACRDQDALKRYVRKFDSQKYLSDLQAIYKDRVRRK